MTYRHKRSKRRFWRRHLVDAAKLGRPAKMVWMMRCRIGRFMGFYPGKYNSVSKTNS